MPTPAKELATRGDAVKTYLAYRKGSAKVRDIPSAIWGQGRGRYDGEMRGFYPEGSQPGTTSVVLSGHDQKMGFLTLDVGSVPATLSVVHFGLTVHASL